MSDKSQQQQFLEDLATEYKFYGDTRTAFLNRFAPENAEKSQKSLGEELSWQNDVDNKEHKLLDELKNNIYPVLRKNDCDIPETNKPGRSKKGESPWELAYKWLWEVKFPEWKERQPESGKTTVTPNPGRWNVSYPQAQPDASKVFVGRKKEQEQFKKTLHYLLNTPNQAEPTLLIINSNGGMGKSSLINQFQLIAKQEEIEINPKPLIVKIDWDEHNISKNLPEQDKAIKLMDLITFYFPNEYQKYFYEYQQTRDKYTDILKSKAEYQHQNQSYLTDEFIKIDSNLFQKINQEKDAFNREFRDKLSPEEQLIFDDPKGCLSRLFVNSLLTLSQKYPLVLLLDTVETILDVKYLYSGLIKYTIPCSKNILLVLAGRISREVETAIRNTLEDRYLYKAELETFSFFDIKDYFIQRFNQSEDSISEYFVKKLYEITDGIPIAVEMIATAFAEDEKSLKSFQDINKENLDTDEICGKVAHRFLKYCLDSEEKTKDRDYIYTLAILHNAINNIPQVCNFIWQQLFPSSITTEEIISRLRREYSFITYNGKIHPVVKNFVCSALKSGEIPTGRLFDINQQALNYFSSKIGSYKEFSRKIRNNDYQKALIKKLNHHLWSRNSATDTLEFLTEIYSLSIRYGELEFAIDFLNLVTEDKLFRSQLSNQDDKFLTDLQFYGTCIKQNSDSPSVIALKEAIQERLNNWEAKSQNLILEAIALARYGNSQKALKLAKQVENLIQNSNDYSDDLGQLYLIIGVNLRKDQNYDNAIIYLEKANNFYSQNNQMVFIELARTNQKIGQIDRSREFYQKALTLNHSLEFARQEMISLGQNYEKQIGDPLQHEVEQCLNFLEEISASTDSKKYYKRHSRLSKLLMQQGKLDDALKSRLIAEDGFSDLACTYNKSSTLYLLLGDEDKALEKAEKALQIITNNNQQDNLGSYLALGDVYRLLKKDNQKAIEYYGKVISNLQDKNQDRKSLFLQKEAYYGLGLTLLLDNQFQNGLTNLKSAETLVENNDDLSDDAQLFNALGIALVLNNAPIRASEQFEKALSLTEKNIQKFPSDYESYYSKMIALIGLNRQEEANNNCKIALRNCHAKGVLKIAL